MSVELLAAVWLIVVPISAVTRELAEGGGALGYEARGRHRLKGVEHDQELFAVRGAPEDAG